MYIKVLNVILQVKACNLRLIFTCILVITECFVEKLIAA